MERVELTPELRKQITSLRDQLKRKINGTRMMGHKGRDDVKFLNGALWFSEVLLGETTPNKLLDESVLTLGLEIVIEHKPMYGGLLIE